ncbi:YqjK-like family protein [Erwiniaceae bacterium BAC15a-03b]|uniref:YqjK-like family protein n=1 Tax=Winslowiella arboricola TaxID=2978220 RepID=A0A9J6PRH8_9GAMM|nr:YqjK-like family protein [Winslowiella arboricola]MCU5771813.1 YqjK-like family protein [Winslowiella arboricola]MCU5776663.1 YqjK-like family protein [Winslowiella arboricola]
MSQRERQQRKAELLGRVQQQRLDLSAARRDWLAHTARYDHGWLTLISLRRYLLLGSSALAIWTTRNTRRKSGFLLRWARRGFGIWSTWRLIRKNLPSAD